MTKTRNWSNNEIEDRLLHRLQEAFPDDLLVRKPATTFDACRMEVPIEKRGGRTSGIVVDFGFVRSEHVAGIIESGTAIALTPATAGQVQEMLAAGKQWQLVWAENSEFMARFERREPYCTRALVLKADCRLSAIVDMKFHKKFQRREAEKAAVDRAMLGAEACFLMTYARDGVVPAEIATVERRWDDAVLYRLRLQCFWPDSISTGEAPREAFEHLKEGR